MLVNGGPPSSPLYPMIQKRLTDEFERIITEQVTPWVFMKTDAGLNVKRLNGKSISYGGIEFAGSARDVFWSRYIEPFLEKLADETIDYVVRECESTQAKLEPALVAVHTGLSAGFRKVYEEMQDVDVRLRGNGYPERVRPKEINHYIQRMEQFVESRIDAEIKLRGRAAWSAFIERFYKRNAGLVWLIGIAIGIAGLVMKLS